MVSLTALWLPILASAIGVFVVSSVLHMVLTYHRTDYSKLANEDEILENLRTQGVEPGEYAFPVCRHPEGHVLSRDDRQVRQGAGGLDDRPSRTDRR